VVLFEREQELAAADAVLRHGGVLVVEGGAGIGKTALLEAACRRAAEGGREVLRGRGSELETEFAFGVVRQLFERFLLSAGPAERAGLLAGPAGPARLLLESQPGGPSAPDISFAMLHGLYWLAVNLSARKPLVIAVDDVHWADPPSLRYLAYLAARVAGLPLALLVASRPPGPGPGEASLLAVRAQASAVSCPALLSQEAVTLIARDRLGPGATSELCGALGQSSGGNPFYLTELLRAAQPGSADPGQPGPAGLSARAGQGVAGPVALRIRRLDARALGLAHALAVLGDGCELRHAAALAGLDLASARRLAAGLVQLDVLAGTDPLRFLHPIVCEAVGASLESAGQHALHLAAARLLQREGARPGRVAAHLMRVQPGGDPAVTAGLRAGAAEAMETGAPQSAATVLRRALAEPPPADERVAVLRELARAEASAGRGTACERLEQALALTTGRRARAGLALEVAEAYAALFRWADAVDLIERALDELGEADPGLAARLEGELVVAGMHDARRSSRVAPVLERLASRPLTGAPAEALAVGKGMAAILAGRPAQEAAAPLGAALQAATLPAENWDTRAALLWSLVVAERFAAVEAALEPMLAEVSRSGSARGLVAVYSTLGLLKLRLGALPEADAAARIALRVLQEGDFAPGLAFAATVLADVAVEAGDLTEAQALLDLLPPRDGPPGVGTVLIPAARGRLRLAQKRPAQALDDFRACLSMFSPELWSMELRDVGYLHARAGAAQALLSLGQREQARTWAEGELADVRVFGAPRALGVAARTAGMAQPGPAGLELLSESVTVLQSSPAVLERAKSLAELGAALRRGGQRSAAREPLAEALDLAARCGARPLAARAREELKAAGARPRREWRHGAEALTPSEMRVARLAAQGRTNREIAQDLYVTLKTIEGHLASAYGKLGITGRQDLRRALGDRPG
jgi:DNA-binding CsgD family transcriptional regulator